MSPRCEVAQNKACSGQRDKPEMHEQGAKVGTHQSSEIMEGRSLFDLSINVRNDEEDKPTNLIVWR